MLCVIFLLETMAPRYEICVGLNKGHKTAKIRQLKYKGEHKTKGVRPQRLKNVRKFLSFYRNNLNSGTFMMKPPLIHSQTLHDWTAFPTMG